MNSRAVLFILMYFILSEAPEGVAQQTGGPNKLYPILFNYARNLYDDYKDIPLERRYVLDEIADYLTGARQIEDKATLLFVGSNNSTRSILAEVWARTAAYYYRISGVDIHSGGTDVVPVTTNTIKALEKAGFIIYKIGEGKNIRYEIKYSYNLPPIMVYAKKYTDKSNPSKGFGSVFVCPNADVNLPVLNGINFRTSLYYFDPSAYESAENAFDEYLDRSRQIATEMFYIFYRLKNEK